jgi:signal transduction histidine kinase
LERYGERMNLQERQEKLDEIQEGVDRMTLLMDDVLLEEQIRMGKLVFKPEPFDLVARCRRWCDELYALHQGRNSITLHLNEIPSEVFMDSKLVQTILTNLLSNAIKYSPPARPVVLSVRRMPSTPSSDDGDSDVLRECQIEFQVQDWGSGIPGDEIPKLFDSFHRCKNVGNIPGTGLGLSIVKQCTHLHGGRVEVQSQLNVSTTFTVLLPARIPACIRIVPPTSIETVPTVLIEGSGRGAYQTLPSIPAK